MTAPPIAKGRVLPTLNEDGSRRWLRPKPAHGAYWRRRRALAYALMAWFVAVPYLRMNGKPLILLDLPARRFKLFGTTFLPTDTLLLMLLLMSGIVGIFLVTALFGRVWCGWACPQTVYMEFLFRPIERWIEGGWNASRKLDALGTRGHWHPRRLAKYAVYGVLALFVAHTFLAYFVGANALFQWVRQSPFEHPTSFLVMAGTTALFFFDFTFFREQMCTVACPYGRWQSVLLDRQSLGVAYDARRGESRGKGKNREGLGDCVDCNACVQACPMGIDIRDGLQMECVHCMQCADACDAVMTKIEKPRGLIRYLSRAAQDGSARRFVRPRTVLYPIVLALFVSAFAWALHERAETEVTVLRGLGAPYLEEPDGRVANQLRVKLVNRSDHAERYAIEIAGAPDATIIAPENPVRVAAGATTTSSLFIVLPASAFSNGEAPVIVRVRDDKVLVAAIPFRLVGPEAPAR